MDISTVETRPLSPPHSGKGEVGPSKLGQQTSHSEPYTPPRSIRIAPSVDANLVSSSPSTEGKTMDVERDLSSQDHYGDPLLYQTAPSHSYYPVQSSYGRTMQYHTPPNPISETGIQTRSGRALRSPVTSGSSEFSGRSRSPKLKRAPRNARAGKSKGPHIDVPLSILTKDYKIPVKDMGAWVHRSVEDRMKEVEKKKGYISRPMNSFMLYRSAFAERVKQFCKENNHQVVSQVTGASWPLEPKAIRDLYEGFANIERDNHHAAHPGYKFAPNKTGKKRTQVEEEDSDDDPDWEGSTRSAKRSRNGRSQSSTPFETDRIPRHHLPQYHQAPPHPSSYQAINPHGPPPMMVDHNGLVGQYYQRTVVPYGQRVDDVRFERVDDPFPAYHMNGPLIGLPHGVNHDLLAPHQSIATPGQMQEDMLDPQLAHYDPNLQYEAYETIDPGYEAAPNYEYGSYARHGELAYPQEVSYHPSMATLTDGHNVWTAPGQAGSDFDEEFRQWD